VRQDRSVAAARVRQPADPQLVEREVLGIVGGLVAELGGARTAPTLHDSLDRDLGISSLERVELLLRI
jgi:acyl carrier protein